MHKFITVALSAAIAVAVASTTPAPAQRAREDARPIGAIAGLLRAFDTHRLVAVGEEHGDVALHRVLRGLIRDPRFARKADVIVVEFASAFHQRTLDRYIRGERVEQRRLTAVWRDSIGGGALGTWDAPIYRQFLATVRSVNRRLPANLRIRVVAGDPAVDWRQVRTREEAERLGLTRDSHYASVVERYVLRRNHRALLISGALHFDRDPNAIAANVARYLDPKYPGALFVAMQTPTEKVEPFVRSWRTPSLALIRGTTLGELRPDVPPGVPFVPSTLEQRADALLHITPFGVAGHFSKAYPSAWRDRDWREVWRRLRLMADEAHEHELFHADCVYGDFQGRGLPQQSREGGLQAEPSPRGALAGGDATPEPGVAAVLAAFDANRAIFLGEAPALNEEHAWIRSLVEARGFAEKVRNVVVAFGNARYQRTLDAYVNGGAVPRTLARVWRDTTQLITRDSPVYAAFFAHVRRVNATLPQERRVRVWLGEPPLSWGDVRGSRDIARILRRQPSFMASLANRALARGERVLVIGPRPLMTRTRGSVRSLVEATNRDVAFSVLPHVGFAAGQRELESRLQPWELGSLARLSQTWLGSLRAGRNNAKSESNRPLADVADAYLYLGPRASLSVRGPFPSTYRDAYWNAVRRRHRLVFGRPLSERVAFPTSDCRRPSVRVDGPTHAAETAAPRAKS